ncbi:MAG: hypothetical protein IJT85_03320 [Ruminococcus sp.]|nr:hypothetical protein [Ruminococcus sp.]
MNNGKIKSAIIGSIAALLCCAIVAAGGNTVANKLCDNKLEVAEKSASGSGSSNSESIDADFSGDIAADAGTDSADAADTGDTSADAAADAGTDAAEADSGTDAAADTSSDAAPASSSSSSSSSSSNASSGKKEITLAAGLTSTNKEEVLKFYQLAAAKNESKTFHQTMTLVELNGGSGAVGGAINAFKPIAKRALEKNSNDNQGVPGKPELIKASDWKSAKAVNDGTYTTLNIQVVEQTDGANGKTNEGTVGRSIGVLDGVQRALDDLDGVTVDFSNAKKFNLKYTNAYIKVKVKNSTGEFVKGTGEWHHTVNIEMDGLNVKLAVFNVTLKGASGKVDYLVTY